METVEVYRSREVADDDELQTLLNSLTMDQVRSAIEVLAPTKKIALKTRKEAMDAVLRTHRSLADIQNTLLDIEASAPFRHCVFSRLQGVGVVQKLKNLTLDPALRSIGFRLRISYAGQTSTCFTFTLEHTVRVREWVNSGPSLKTIQSSTMRHPILIRLYVDQGIAAFFYPGFSQGSGTPRNETISYEELIADAMAFIGTLGDVSFTALPVRQCLKVFVEGANARVRVVRSDVDASSGRVSLSSAYQEKAVEEVLLDYLGDLPEDVRALVLDRGRRALGTSTANSVVLFWFDEKVVTRLQFWDIGTDMLFVWHGVPNTFRIVEEIVNLFQMTYQMLPSTNAGSPLEWLSKMPAGDTVRPAELASMFNLSMEESRQNLLSAMKIGLLQPVYRLRTVELLIARSNDWTKDPSELNSQFEIDGGGEIDGQDPKNIEVAFLRVDTGGRK